MNLKKLTLEECLENNTDEYYIVDYNGEEHEFFFYKNQDIANMCVEEKSLYSC